MIAPDVSLTVRLSLAAFAPTPPRRCFRPTHSQTPHVYAFCVSSASCVSCASSSYPFSSFSSLQFLTSLSLNWYLSFYASSSFSSSSFLLVRILCWRSPHHLLPQLNPLQSQSPTSSSAVEMLIQSQTAIFSSVLFALFCLHLNQNPHWQRQDDYSHFSSLAYTEPL